MTPRASHTKREGEKYGFTEAGIVRFAGKIRFVDDKLGGFADYEGTVNGPTYDSWSRAYFTERAESAIYWHLEAVKLWRAALARSRPQSPRRGKR